MAWVKLDDQWMDHPKIIRAGRDARDMWLASITWCAKHLTDGFFPTNLLPQLAVMAGIDVANCHTFATTLLQLCLWDATDGGYMVHDYLDYNPTKEQVLSTREARKEAGRAGGNAKASKLPSKPLAKPYQKPAPSPSPSQGTRSKGNGKSNDSESAKRAPLFPLASTLAEVCCMNFEANKGRLFKEAQLLNGKITPEQMRIEYGSGSIWYLWDWRGRKGERPTPATIRETLGALKEPAKSNGNGQFPAPRKVIKYDAHNNPQEFEE